MSKAHDKQIRFVMKALALNLTDSVELAAIWFRDTKAWHLSLDDAIAKFKDWLPSSSEPVRVKTLVALAECNGTITRPQTTNGDAHCGPESSTANSTICAPHHINRPVASDFLSPVSYRQALEAYCTELEQKSSGINETLKMTLSTLMSAMRGNVDQRWFLESIGAVESVLATTRPQGTTGAPSEG